MFPPRCFESLFFLLREKQAKQTNIKTDRYQGHVTRLMSGEPCLTVTRDVSLCWSYSAEAVVRTDRKEGKWCGWVRQKQELPSRVWGAHT